MFDALTAVDRVALPSQSLEILRLRQHHCCCADITASIVVENGKLKLKLLFAEAEGIAAAEVTRSEVAVTKAVEETEMKFFF